MKTKKILCPVDLSPFSEQAIEVASSMAKAENGRVFFLYVATPELPISSGLAIPEVNRVIDEQRQKFEKIKPTIDGVQFEHHLVRGDPIREITDFVDEHQIDLVVMPTHGRSGLSRLLMGSVAEQVVRHAACPVLIVKTPAGVHA